MLQSPSILNNLKIVGNKIVIYSTVVENVGKRRYNGENLKKDRKKAYKGEQSKAGVKRVKENLYSWCYSIVEGNKQYKRNGTKKEIKLVLATLTLCSKQIHSDKEIKSKILEPFLKYLKNNFNVVNYFWRAEPQENGNIHFHLVIDRYIDKVDLQEYWNNYQNKLGYIDRYYEKTGKVNPPSTQIEVFNGNAKSIEYLLKYLTKENKRRKIEGLQMRVSNKLAHIKINVVELAKSEELELSKLLEKTAAKKYVNDYSTTYFFNFDANFYFKNHFIGFRSKQYYLKMYESLYVKNLSSFEIYVVSLYYFDRFKFNSVVKSLVNSGKPFENIVELIKL